MAREKILKTAAGLFYARGINSVGVDLIVARARVTKTSLYRHFASKEILVAASLERINDEWSSWLKAGVAGASDDPRSLADQLLLVADGAIVRAAMTGEAGSAAVAKKAARTLIQPDSTAVSPRPARGWRLKKRRRARR